MKISVRLYGTLGNHISGHDPLNGMEIEVPDDATAGDLIDQLAIPRKKVGIISVDGNLVKKTQPLHRGNVVRIYRPIAGG
jgi:sulfur carrier protein ThiS